MLELNQSVTASSSPQSSRLRVTVGRIDPKSLRPYRGPSSAPLTVGSVVPGTRPSVASRPHHRSPSPPVVAVAVHHLCLWPLLLANQDDL
jgi:hypothetical protein